MKGVGAEPEVQLATVDAAPDAAIEIRDAATVILASDRPDLHVLVLKRTHRAAFGPRRDGVSRRGRRSCRPRHRLAFRLARRIVGLDDPAASRDQRVAHGGLSFRIAALRECFEEAGILLARDAATGQPAEHDADLARARIELNAGRVSFEEVLATRDVVFDARELRVFAHWLTPLGSPRRYNTWFFVAPAPDGEEGTHDDNELVASAWVRPLDALAQLARGEIDLIFPTEMSLRALSHYDRSQDLLRDLDAVARDANGHPVVVSEGNGERVALPADAGRPTHQWTIPLPDISFRHEREEARKASC